RPATGHAGLRGGARKPAALRRTGQRVTTARPAARLRRRGRRPATGHAGLRGGARKPAALRRTGQRITTARPAARLRRRGRRTDAGHSRAADGAPGTAPAAGRRRQRHLPRDRPRPTRH
ncbi:hypothetical protein KV205_35120, partial [Streptomyces sp. SKN60]|nr:hypothetical protein [Streptomyces sp. SKN60]